MSKSRLISLVALATAAASSQATILTFNISGISNSQAINQNYGDNVTVATMGGFSYGVGAEGFTPDVTTVYGNNDPNLWTTGYGNLTNILFEDQDSSGVLSVTLTAATGFDVILFGFDMAAFSSAFSSDPTVQSITITDGGSNTFFSQANGTVSESTHTPFDFSANPITAGKLVITVDARNLGSLNDDIGVDNIRFGQAASVPEPASLATLAIGGLALLRRRRK